MECEATQEAVQAIGTAKGEVVAEAVAGDVHHRVLVWEGWHGALWVFIAEGFVEKDKVCEAAANGCLGFLE